MVRFGSQQTLTPEQQKVNTEAWSQLIQHWTQQVTFIGSNLITQPGYVVSGPERKLDQGFMADADSRVVSIIRLRTDTLDNAVEMAKACPTLDVGGTVEVREVQPSPFVNQ